MNITAMNHLSTTEQLRALEAQREDARSRMTNLSDPASGQEFSRLTTEIGSLAASFVLYQGQEVPATLVNYLSGNIPTSTVDHDGDEELLRDEAGRYYLRRVLNCLDAQGESRPASGRTLVHRIGVNAAILWATTRLNSETLDLRCDAAALLAKPKPTGAGNVALAAEVPADFLAVAKRLGHDPKTLLWHLAEDLCANPPASLNTAVQESGPAEPAEATSVSAADSVHRFVFDYPATRNICGRQRTVELDDEQMKRAGELAAIFDLTPTQFLRGLADLNNLPAQPRRSGDKLEGLLRAEHLAFVCMDEAMAKRIERAAQARSQTADEFVASAMGSDVDMWEEAMLVHPTTGELLEADYEELYTEIESAYRITAPPVGHEDDPWYQASRPQPVGMTARLEKQASSLVRRYLDTTPFDYTAADIVSGCVVLALNQAFDNLEEAQKYGHVDSAEFHDGGWGYVEEAIYEAQKRHADTSELSHEPKEAA